MSLTLGLKTWVLNSTVLSASSDRYLTSVFASINGVLGSGQMSSDMPSSLNTL